MAVLDLASDDVNSRIVSAAIFLLIPSYLLHVSLYKGTIFHVKNLIHFESQLFFGDTMNFTSIPSDDLQPGSIELFNLPTSGGLLSSQLSKAFVFVMTFVDFFL